MDTIFLLAILALLILAIALIILFRNKTSSENPALINKLNEIQAILMTMDAGLKQDFKINRQENASIAKDNRTELNTSLKDFTLEQRNKFDELKLEQKDLTFKTVEQLDKITDKVAEKLKDLNEQAKADNALMRDALINAFKGFQETFDKNVSSFNDLQKEKFAQMEIKQSELMRNTENKLEFIRTTVEEKLEKTLSERLGQSFETVGKQLIEVQKGLGEMQTLAQDVGGLKGY